MTKRRRVQGRAYLLELLDSSRNRHYFRIEASNDDVAHEKSEDIIKQYMTAISKIYQTVEASSDEHVEQMLDQLSMSSKFLLEQAQVRLVNPDFSEMSEEDLEMANAIIEKGRKGGPIRETLLWQLREVQ